MWPNWLKQIYPKTNKRSENFCTSIHVSDDKLFLQPDLRSRSGDTHSRKFKIFCHKCNNEWASALEDTAKPLISKLLTGNCLFLNAFEKEVLAKWIVLFTIVAEYDHPEYISISDAQVRNFRITSQIPDGWFIWMGATESYKNKVWTRLQYSHSGVLLAHPDDIPIILKPNTQSTAFSIGDFFAW